MSYISNLKAIMNHPHSPAMRPTYTYYPYGMPMATSTGAAVNRYKYSGKELETRNGLNFYDFEARLQFPAINLMNQTDVNAHDYNGTKLFELLSKGVTAKSGNEIGLIRTGALGKGTNYITSAKQYRSEPGGPALFHSQLKNGYVIREFTHSHIENASPSYSDVKCHKDIL